jgi:4-carboxymuconolactone decarboxylase
MLAMLLNTFQVDLKPGDQPPFPDVRDFAKVSDPRN